MKKLVTIVAITLLTFNLSAQQTKPAAKATVKKETTAKKSPAEEKATGTSEEKEKCSKTSKSCCAKKA